MNIYIRVIALLLLVMSNMANASQVNAQTNAEASTESQTQTEQQTEQEEEIESYWELELGVVLLGGRYSMDSLNSSEHGFATITPWLSGGYYNGNFFIESDPANAKPLTIGYTGYETDDLQINLVATPYFFGFDEDTQQSGDLLTGLEEREASFEAGLEILSSHDFGQVGVRMLHDISDTHGGFALEAMYGYPLYFDRTVIWPSVGLSYVSEQANDYYYGIRPFEARADRPVYSAPDGFVTKFNLYFEHELSESNSIIGFSQINVLNSAVVNSPLVQHKYSFTVGVGYIWIF